MQFRRRERASPSNLIRVQPMFSLRESGLIAPVSVAVGSSGCWRRAPRRFYPDIAVRMLPVGRPYIRPDRSTLASCVAKVVQILGLRLPVSYRGGVRRQSTTEGNAQVAFPFLGWQWLPVHDLVAPIHDHQRLDRGHLGGRRSGFGCYRGCWWRCVRSRRQGRIRGRWRRCVCGRRRGRIRECRWRRVLGRCLWRVS